MKILLAAAALFCLLQDRRQAQPLGEKSGLVPLTELAAKYKGEDGGLYGGGKNDPPKAHADAAKAEIAKIKPVDGKVVLLSIGMSNTTQEFSRFVQIAPKSDRIVLVDGAQGGQDASRWSSADAPTWAAADKRLEAAGVTPKQVQVVWIKQALAGPGRIGEYPAHAKRLQEDLAKIVRVARARYPNLRVAYLSSRVYAGYAKTQLNPEPYAYETAFAVRALILDQIQGDKELSVADGRAPLLLWGPYLWADGATPRKSDKLSWDAKDFGQDGTHPSDSGREKVAQQLLGFLKNDPLARDWFQP